MQQDFEVWWQQYPRKVGKLAAMKAYQHARKTGATSEQLLAGIAKYLVHKPAYADWCHPKTWLSQGRWLDAYETEVFDDPDAWRNCQHEPRCPSWQWHAVQLARQRGEV